ncbi:uncharacterized protein LOC116012407 [Ipomoea triloba]|uniref:uncharacterized protein LOC116012407 n=1 Tax=Ipomoea triloba TaxID=35885 RepID=UPI00125E41EA|nr:uncharacterized protein LOC116012407 [Ipomoea triloba]
MQCTDTLSISNIRLPLIRASVIDTKPSHYQLKPRAQSCSCTSNSHVNSAIFDGDNSKVLQNTIALPHHVTAISSTSNPFVKHCLKLRSSSSYRHSHGLVLVVGTTPIREICKFQETMAETPIKIECLLVLDDTQIPEELDIRSARVVHVSSIVMKKLSGVQSIDSIQMIALFRIPSTFHSVGDDFREDDCSRWFPSANRILVLDGIQDPGNLGTLLRSALAFRWNGAFLLPGCCDPFNEKALRASRGACFQLPLVSGGWTQLQTLGESFKMKMLAGHPANDGRLKPVSRLCQGFADSLADQPLCLVLGSEGGGLSEKSREVCELVSIPMAGEFESLNVSVAGGILLYMLQPENHIF